MRVLCKAFLEGGNCDREGFEEQLCFDICWG